MNMNECFQPAPSPEHLQLFQEGVKNFKKAFHKELNHAGVKYIEFPKDVLVWNEDWACYLRAEYKGYVIEQTDGHGLIIKIRPDGERDLIEELGNLGECIKWIDGDGHV